MADYQTCKQCFVRVRLVPGVTYLCSACKRPLPGLEANAPAESGSAAPPAPGLARSLPASISAEAPVQLVAKRAVEGAPPPPRRATVVAIQPSAEGTAPPKSSRARPGDESWDDDRPGRSRRGAQSPRGGIGFARILGAVGALLATLLVVGLRFYFIAVEPKPVPNPNAPRELTPVEAAAWKATQRDETERTLASLRWAVADYPKLGVRAELPGRVTEWPAWPMRLGNASVESEWVEAKSVFASGYKLISLPKSKAPMGFGPLQTAVAKSLSFHGGKIESGPAGSDLGFPATRTTWDSPSGRSLLYGWEDAEAFRFAVIEMRLTFDEGDWSAFDQANARFLKSIKPLGAPASPAANATALAPGAGGAGGDDPFKPAPSAPPSAGEPNPFTPVPPKLPKRPAPAPPTSPPPKSPRPAPARKSAFTEAGSVAKHLVALDTGRDTDFLTVEAGSREHEFRVMRYSLPKCQLIGAQNFDGDIAEAVFDPEYQRLFVATTSAPLGAPGLPRPLAGTGTVRAYSLKELLGLDRESRGEALNKGAASAEAMLTNRHVRGLKLGPDGEWVVAIAQPPSGEGKSAKAAGPQVLKFDAKTLAVRGQLGYAKPLLTTAVNPTTGDVAVVPHPFNPFGALALGTPDPDATLELVDGVKWAKKRSVRLDFNPAGAAYSAKGALVVSGVRGTRGVLVGINVRGADEVTSYSKSDDRGPVPYGEV